MGNKASSRALPIMQHVYDFGSQDPFCARMMFQIFNIRDHIFSTSAERDAFDKVYDPILQNLTEAKFVKERAIGIIEEHIKKVETGEIAHFDGNAITVKEYVDTDLNIWFKDFFIRGRIATEQMKHVAKIFGYDFTFILGKEVNFQKGKKELLESEESGVLKYLLDLIEDHRNTWYSAFATQRAEIEHGGFKLPQTRYSLDDKGIVHANLPVAYDKNIPDFLEMLWKNLFALCEDTVVLLMASRVKSPFTLRHIPVDDRNPEMPMRFVIDIAPDEKLLKEISYKEAVEKEKKRRLEK